MWSPSCVCSLLDLIGILGCNSIASSKQRAGQASIPAVRMVPSPVRWDRTETHRTHPYRFQPSASPPKNGAKLALGRPKPAKRTGPKQPKATPKGAIPHTQPWVLPTRGNALLLTRDRQMRRLGPWKTLVGVCCVVGTGLRPRTGLCEARNQDLAIPWATWSKAQFQGGRGG